MQEAGLQLPPRSMHQFDELEDIVSSDLVLVMDDFDLQEVGAACRSGPALRALVDLLL